MEIVLTGGLRQKSHYRTGYTECYTLEAVLRADGAPVFLGQLRAHERTEDVFGSTDGVAVDVTPFRVEAIIGEEIIR